MTENAELARVMRERDELQTLLDKFERHMAEVGKYYKLFDEDELGSSQILHILLISDEADMRRIIVG